jgi:dolichyl-diphosphooligosaccharide--protein glycosyltransferase
VSAYIFDTESFQSGLPNVYQTITEARSMPIKELMQIIFINPIIIIFALIGLGILIKRHLRAMLPILPVFALGLVVFIGSFRFVMYLVPFLAVGLGYLINFAVNKIPDSRLPAAIHKRNFASASKDLLGYVLAGLLVLTIAKTPLQGFLFSSAPSVAIPPITLNTIKTMGQAIPAGSAIYTWWDYGLAIEAETGLATFHDGMTQNTLKTWLIARSYTQDSATFASYARYIANNGVSELNAQVDGGIKPTEIIAQVESYDAPLAKDNVYIAFTSDMIQKYQSINHLGSWNIVDGVPPRNAEGIDMLTCNPPVQVQGGSIYCAGTETSLSTGTINGIPLRRIAYMDLTSGRITMTSDWHGDSDLSLVAVQEGGTTYMLLIASEAIYNSAFFQLYIAGNYDPAVYEEVISAFPLSRVYKLK